MYTCCETHCGCAFAGSIHRSGCCLFRVLEYLRLGCAGVAQQQNVDVPSHSVHASRPCLFVAAAKEGERNGSLHVAVAVYRWGDGANNALTNLQADQSSVYGQAITSMSQQDRSHRRSSSSKICVGLV
jgi:hypothetical protein